MCSVGLIAGMSAIAGVMGSASSASAQAQAQAEQERANAYQIAVAQDNARVKNMQADDALEQGEKEEKLHRLNLSKSLGSKKSAAAASGVELNGSPGEQLQDLASWGEYDANTIKENARRQAWGYQVDANNSLNRANFLQGKTFGNSFSSASGLLSGATSVARSLHGMV